MKRGDIWLINFDPSIGGEIKKTRPAIIVSNDYSNQYINRLQVIPTTSNTDKIYPCECIVSIKRKKSKAMADQIMTVSKLRLIKRLGKLKPGELVSLEKAIKVQLGFFD
ncbi:type II toxin-antitoxin system PemK/MazF family toxin [Candidatus Riflebacteria bacterium]